MQQPSEAALMGAGNAPREIPGCAEQGAVLALQLGTARLAAVAGPSSLQEEQDVPRWLQWVDVCIGPWQVHLETE